MTTITQYQNPKQVRGTLFDVEANTEEFGWIPLSIDMDNVETDLPHMVQTSDWLLANDNLIDYKTAAEIEAEDLLIAQTAKKIEINNHADALIENAYSNPTQTTTADPIIHRRDVEFRRNDKADKLAGEISLTQAEKDEAKIDQKLSEYEVKIYQDSDKAKTNMYKLNTSTEVNAFDVSAENWNLWISP